MSVMEWPQEIRERRVSRGPAQGNLAALLCGTEEFCQEARLELLRRRPHACVRSTSSLEEARAAIEREFPQAILAEDRALIRPMAASRERRQSLAAALSLLAASAPVVWIGIEEDAREVTLLVPSLEADFVPRSPLSLPAAVGVLERRLRLANSAGDATMAARPLALPEGIELGGRDFGEILRHELNNPLTGILGNAELLLMEVRRGRLELPAHNLQRLEVIADLAVRMRETVRQLSDHWIAAGGRSGGPKQMMPGEAEPHSFSG